MITRGSVKTAMRGTQKDNPMCPINSRSLLFCQVYLETAKTFSVTFHVGPKLRYIRTIRPFTTFSGTFHVTFSVAFSFAFHVALSAASDVVVGGLVYAKQVHDAEVAFQYAIAIHRGSCSTILFGFLNASVICQESFHMFCKVMGQA